MKTLQTNSAISDKLQSYQSADLLEEGLTSLTLQTYFVVVIIKLNLGKASPALIPVFWCHAWCHIFLVRAASQGVNSQNPEQIDILVDCGSRKMEPLWNHSSYLSFVTYTA